MPNQLFNMLGNNNPMSGLLSRFQQFKNAFSGDPRQVVQGLLNSGQMSQQQFNQLQQMASQFQKLLK